MNANKYSGSLIRFEARGAHPPTKSYADELAALAEKSGLQAFWHSAVDPHGVPLFPSKIIPKCHPNANSESFHYLMEKLHRLGCVVISWYPFMHSKAILDVHPDWAVKFYTPDGPRVASDFICPNSPFKELLPEFCVEVIKELDFDGFWFDGFRWDFVGNPGCRCGFCEKKFKDDSGLAIPEGIDYEDRTFRVWMKWRYQIIHKMASETCKAIKSARSNTVVCFNNYRRRSVSKAPGWITGISLSPWNLDCMMSSEVGSAWADVHFQVKMQQAYGCSDGAETWLPLSDLYSAWVPDLDLLVPEQAVISAAIQGAGLSCGSASSLKFLQGQLTAINKKTLPLAPYRNGSQIPYAAVLVSQNTMDYRTGENNPRYWDEAFGAFEILKHSHLQSSVVFDGHIENNELSKYPVLVLGNCECLSKSNSLVIRRYIQDGGIVFCCKNAGVYDELGYPHAKPILDEMIGIKSRKESPAPHLPTLELLDLDLQEVAGKYLTFTGVVNSHNENYVCVETDESVEILANVVCRVGSPGGVWDEDGINGGIEFQRHPGLVRRKIGKGWIVYSCVNYFYSYLTAPRPATMRLFKKLLTSLRKPEITLEGPMCATISAIRTDDNSITVHLHNAPGSTYCYPSPPDQNFLWAIGELNPLHNMKVIANGLHIESAELPLKNTSAEVVGNNTVLIRELSQYEVVILKCCTRSTKCSEQRKANDAEEKSVDKKTPVGSRT